MKAPWLATLGLVVIVAFVVGLIAWALWPRKPKTGIGSEEYNRRMFQDHPPEKR